MSGVITFGKSSGNKKSTKSGKATQPNDPGNFTDFSNSTNSKARRNSNASKSLHSFSLDPDLNPPAEDSFGEAPSPFSSPDRTSKARGASKLAFPYVLGPGSVIAASGPAAERYQDRFSPYQRHQDGPVRSPDGSALGLFRKGNLTNYVSLDALSDGPYSQEKTQSGYVLRSEGLRNGSSTIIFNAPNIPSTPPSAVGLPDVLAEVQPHSVTGKRKRTSIYEQSDSLIPSKILKMSNQKTLKDKSSVLKSGLTVLNQGPGGSKALPYSLFPTAFQSKSFTWNPSASDPTEALLPERLSHLSFKNRLDSWVASAFYAIMNEPLLPLEKLEKLEKLKNLMERTQKLHSP